MSNPVFMSVSITGDRRQMRSLYQKMLRLQNRKKPLVENTFYYPKRWLGNLVTRLGGDYHEVYSRGTWYDLQLNDTQLYFFTETAWNAPYDVLRLIQKVYPRLEIYFAAEGDGWDVYETNDKKGRFYSSRFALDMPLDIEYYDTIEEVAERIAAYIGRKIRPTIEAVYEAIGEWEEVNTDSEAYINLKEFELVELGSLHT